MATNDKKDKKSTSPAQAEAEGQGGFEVLFPKPPDGGWGWVIVFASVLANIIVDGITYTFGIFLPKFQEAFQQPKSTIALAGSLQVGTYLCAGPIVSALTNRFGCKKVTMMGSVIATVGFVLSVFAPSADILILTFGIIGGFGFGMMYLPAIVIVGFYFEKRRALATGIAVCGSGIGMFIMAPLSDLLLQEFGYKGALLVIAGLVLNGAICGALMRPLPVMQTTSNLSNKDKATKAEQPEVKEPLMKSVPKENGNDVAKPPEKKPEPETQRAAIVILDEGPSSSARKTGRDEFAFFSVPNVVYASTKDPKANLPAGGRQRSNTLDQSEKIRLRHIVKEIVPQAPKPARTPIGLSYIGLSDAQINRVRETANVNVSRRDIFMSAGSRLQIPDASLWRSAQSMRSYRQEQAEKILCACVPESARDSLLQMLDFSIMANKAYVFILIGNIFAMLGFYVPFVFMPEKALGHGIGEAEAAFLLSIIGITNTVGRVLTGVLANLNKIDSLMINNFAMLLCGIATFVTPFCTDYVLLCIVAAVFGLCVAAYISLSSILLCDMLGVEQLTNAFGFLTLARGISSCAGSPLAGAIIDSTKNVDLAFFVGGGLIVVGALCHFLLFTPCIRHKKVPVTQESDTEDEA